MKKLLLIVALASCLFADNYSFYKCKNALDMISEYGDKLQIDFKEKNAFAVRWDLDMVLAFNKDGIVSCDAKTKKILEDSRVKLLKIRQEAEDLR